MTDQPIAVAWSLRYTLASARHSVDYFLVLIEDFLLTGFDRKDHIDWTVYQYSGVEEAQDAAIRATASAENQGYVMVAGPRHRRMQVEHDHPRVWLRGLVGTPRNAALDTLYLTTITEGLDNVA